MKAMTNEEKELADLFQKTLGTLPSAEGLFSPTSIPGVRGNEACTVHSEFDAFARSEHTSYKVPPLEMC
jgi:hypothetical protein